MNVSVELLLKIVKVLNKAFMFSLLYFLIIAGVTFGETCFSDKEMSGEANILLTVIMFIVALLAIFKVTLSSIRDILTNELKKKENK